MFMKNGFDLCAMEECENGPGPGSLEFSYNGDPIGFICADCINESPGVRVVLARAEGTYTVGATTFLDKVI
jgi:hypothetical protein